jgi:hypothetical protein
MRPRSIILPSRKIAERSQCNLDPMIWTWKLERKSVHLRSRCFLDSFQINTGTTQHFDNFRQARVLSITEKRPVNCSDERMPSTAASISCITFSAGWTDSVMDPYQIYAVELSILSSSCLKTKQLLRSIVPLSMTRQSQSRTCRYISRVKTSL